MEHLGNRQLPTSPALPTLRMTTTRAGHAALFHHHVKLTAAWAGLAAWRVQSNHLRLGVGFQAHAFTLDKACGDHVTLDHTAYSG